MRKGRTIACQDRQSPGSCCALASRPFISDSLCCTTNPDIPAGLNKHRTVLMVGHVIDEAGRGNRREKGGGQEEARSSFEQFSITSIFAVDLSNQKNISQNDDHSRYRSVLFVRD